MNKNIANTKIIIKIVVNVLLSIFLLMQVYNIYLDNRHLDIYITEIEQKLNIFRISNYNDIIRIRDYIINDINTKNPVMVKNRPKTGYSVYEIVSSREGLCGEGARLLYYILRYNGIQSRRVYLYGNNQKHVILEVLFDERWYLLETINGPGKNFKDFLDTNYFDIKSQFEINSTNDSYITKIFDNFSYFPTNLIPYDYYLHIPFPGFINFIAESPAVLYLILLIFLLFLINVSNLYKAALKISRKRK